jgi:leader peptidase (prepilin peptidase)/N-methyltransferase
LSYLVALMLGAAAIASLWAAPDLHGVAGALLAALMAAIVVSDWRSYRVPDRLNALAVALRGLDILFLSEGARFGAALEALTRALVTAATFYLFRAVYGKLRGREGLGLGDVKLAGVAGAWIGWRLLPWVVEAAAIFVLGLAFWRARNKGNLPKADARLPFAVGFAPAIWLGWCVQQLGF